MLRTDQTMTTQLTDAEVLLNQVKTQKQKAKCETIKLDEKQEYLRKLINLIEEDISMRDNCSIEDEACV